MAVTIKDVAKVCNVSYSTVSRVLNGKVVRSNPRNDRIIATAKALGYKPNKLAVQLVKQSSNMLGLMIPDVSNPHYSEITKCVEDAALAAGYRVFLCNTDWDVRKEEMYRDSLLECRVAGIIVMPVCDESHVMFRGLDIPVVLLGSRTMEPGLGYVTMDNEHAAFLATEYLLQQGYSRLCYLGRYMENYTSADRARGFLRAAKAFGAHKALVLENEGYGLSSACRVIKALLVGSNPPNGILAFNDYLAIGAMQAVEEAGLAVGRDVGVMGFDDILFSSLPKISLTTITPSNEELGRKALTMITDYKAHAEAGSLPAILEPHMILRSTTG